MTGFRWPEMEARIRGALRADPARWQAVRAERRRRRGTLLARIAQWWPLFIGGGGAFLFLMPLVLSSIGGALFLEAFVAFVLACLLARCFIDAIAGPQGVAPFYLPVEPETVVARVGANLARRSVLGLVALLVLHALSAWRAGSLAEAGIPVVQWIVAIATAVFLVCGVWLREGRVLWWAFLITGLLLIVCMVCRPGPAHDAILLIALLSTSGQVAWSASHASSPFAWLALLPSLVLIAWIPRSLRGLVRRYQISDLVGSAPVPQTAPLAATPSVRQPARVCLDVFHRPNLLQRWTARLLSERQRTVAEVLLFRLQKGWMGLLTWWVLAAVLSLAAASFTLLAAHIQSLSDEVRIMGRGTALAVGFFGLIWIYLPFQRAYGRLCPSEDARPSAIFHLPVGLWEVTRVTLKQLLVSWLLWLPIAAGVGLVLWLHTGTEGMVQAARVALTLLALMPLLAVEHVLSLHGREGAHLPPAVGGVLLTIVGLAGAVGMVVPVFRGSQAFCAFALPAWTLFCWCAVEWWSRHGRGDQVFVLRRR